MPHSTQPPIKFNMLLFLCTLLIYIPFKPNQKSTFGELMNECPSCIVKYVAVQKSFVSNVPYVVFVFANPFINCKHVPLNVPPPYEYDVCVNPVYSTSVKSQSGGVDVGVGLGLSVGVGVAVNTITPTPKSQLGVADGVGVGVLLDDGVGVGVAVNTTTPTPKLQLGVADGVGLGVVEGLIVGVGVAVNTTTPTPKLQFGVADGVGVGVAVNTTTPTPKLQLGVTLGVGVGLDDGVGVGVLVGVEVGGSGQLPKLRVIELTLVVPLITQPLLGEFVVV